MPRTTNKTSDVIVMSSLPGVLRLFVDGEPVDIKPGEQSMTLSDALRAQLEQYGASITLRVAA